MPSFTLFSNGSPLEVITKLLHSPCTLWLPMSPTAWVMVRCCYYIQRMEPVNVPIYDFNHHKRSKEVRRVDPADVVLIEGILVLFMDSVRDFLNMKIFVDTDDDVRLARRWLFFSFNLLHCLVVFNFHEKMNNSSASLLESHYYP